ncbi:MAG: ABC-2 family transporter protein [Nanoarchaeota archaeon]|nr:ABC-2 family transporter protein [Nanoarchaeota archaeon]
MEFEVKSFTWKRNFNYIKTSFYILWKRTTEYKLNTYVALFDQFWYYLTQVLFFYVLFSNFSSIINWKLDDYILFGLIVDLIYVFTGLFIWNGIFQNILVRGDLNNHLIRPINPVISYHFSSLSVGALVFIITNILIFPFLLFFFKIKLYNLFLAFLILILLLLVFTLSYFFVRSINFFSFGLSSVFTLIFESGNYNIAKKYPFGFFEKLDYNFFLLALPLFFTSSLLIPILKSYEIIHFELQIIFLFSLIFFFGIGGYLMWYYGLKNYEAFG